MQNRFAGLVCSSVSAPSSIRGKGSVPRSQAGFTFIELMGTLVIGGILAALTIPNVSEMREGYRLRGATREVYIALQKARMTAVKENTSCIFSLEGTTYKLQRDVNNDGFPDDTDPIIAQKDLSEDYTAIEASFEGTSEDGTGNYLAFGPSGTVRGSIGAAVGWVSNASGEKKYVYVSASGRVRITDEPEA